MIHPLVRLLATEPHLVADHVGAYAALIECEAKEVQRRWTLRLALSVVALVCLVIAAMLTGVALMLWAVTPGLSTGAQWVLGAAPAVPLLVAIAAGLAAKRPSAERAFAGIKAQIQSDLNMIHQARSA
ncbi:MAG: hypothetical protein ACM32J_08205 [Rhizobacter sp.]|jgi:hypothetical protein